MKPTVGYGSFQIFPLKYQGVLQWVFKKTSCYVTSKLVSPTTWYIPCFLKEN